MKVLMLLSNPYRPDPRVQKEARALVEAGHSVKVLCWDRAWEHEGFSVDGGVSIVRIRTKRFESKKGIFWNYPFFFFKALSMCRNEEFDAVHCHDLDTLPVGISVARFNDVPIIYDAHEHYAKMVEGDVPKALSKCLDLAEGWMVRTVDRVIAANDMISDYLAKRSRLPPMVVMNCVDIEPSIINRHDRKGDVVLFYGGALEPLRYVEEMIEQCQSANKVVLRFAGRGTLESKIKEVSRKCPNVQFLGFLSKTEMAKEMASADGVIALLDPSNENNRIGTPNRMFEAMAYGTPVIATEGTLSGDIVKSVGAGIVIDWSKNSLNEIAFALEDRGRSREMGENGKKAVLSEYNWTTMKTRLVKLYDGL